jgi:ubiquinone/menaquinone biosynthesis C-methylase UbiE
MSLFTAKDIKKRFFRTEKHPYRMYEAKISSMLTGTETLLDAGCGRSAPILRKFKGKAEKLIGIDLEKPSDCHDIFYEQCDIACMESVEDCYVDIVMSRAVLEHVQDPNAVFSEISRILKPGGSFVFIAPNFWDYVSLISWLTPNSFHKLIVNKTEGRSQEDVFPAYYRANTYKDIKRLSAQNNLVIESFEWVGQFPSIMKFNIVLLWGATFYELVINHFHALRFLRGWVFVHLKKNRNLEDR